MDLNFEVFDSIWKWHLVFNIVDNFERTNQKNNFRNVPQCGKRLFKELAWWIRKNVKFFAYLNNVRGRWVRKFSHFAEIGGRGFEAGSGVDSREISAEKIKETSQVYFAHHSSSSFRHTDFCNTVFFHALTHTPEWITMETDLSLIIVRTK